MAKKNLNKKGDMQEIQEEIVVEDTVMETPEKVENEVTIETPEKEEKIKPSKMVKIKLKRKHKCHIGGEWYSFEKEKQYTVPEEVKIILNQNDLLMPI